MRSESTIDERLEGADVILLLVTASFIASDYCWTVEMRRAIERHREGTAIVVPVICRDSDWTSAPFAAIQALPSGGKSVASWRPRERGWASVVGGLRKTLEKWSKSYKAIGTSVQPESPVQRAQRLAADQAARKARAQLLQVQGHSAFQRESAEIFRLVNERAREISATEPSLGLKSGSTDKIATVRLSPLTLHLYRYYEGEAEKSFVTSELLFGGVLLPGEQGIFFPEQPRAHSTVKYFFTVSASGQWGWKDPSGTFVHSGDVADQAIHSLLDLKDAVASGKVTSPFRGGA